MEQKRFWLLKTEPSDFSWDAMEREFRTCWDGVRNHQAQANLRRASLNDTAFFYHTGNQRAIVGVVKVVRCFYFLQHLKFGCVDVEFLHALRRIVTLEEIKSEKRLRGMSIIRQPRLSVSEVSLEEWNTIMEMANS